MRKKRKEGRTWTRMMVKVTGRGRRDNMMTGQRGRLGHSYGAEYRAGNRDTAPPATVFGAEQQVATSAVMRHGNMDVSG